MKLQLDTKNKTIKIEEDVNLNELFETVQSLLPNNLWKEFTLETNVTVNWVNPITIYPEPYNPYPTYPWYEIPTTICDNVTQYSLNKGVYNVEFKIN